MAWQWLAGCFGSRNNIYFPPIESTPPSLPLTRPPPAPERQQQMTRRTGSPAAHVLPDPKAAAQLARQWQQAFAPAPAAVPLAPPTPSLVQRCQLLQLLRAQNMQPSPTDLQRMLSEGLQEMRQQARWMDRMGRPISAQGAEPRVVQTSASLLLSAFPQGPAKECIVHTAILSLLQIRDEALCHRGTEGDTKTALIEFVQQTQSVAYKPLVLEIALARAPASAPSLGRYLPLMTLSPKEQTDMAQRLKWRAHLLQSPPRRHQAAEEVLSGGRLRLLEECDALAHFAGIAAPIETRRWLRQACLFDLEIVVLLPWRVGDAGSWPAAQASAAWLSHRQRLIRLFSHEIEAVRVQLSVIEHKTGRRQPETMRRVFSALQQRTITHDA